MARARKPSTNERRLEVDVNRPGFEDDGGWKIGWYARNNPHRLTQCIASELDIMAEPSLFTDPARKSLASRFDLEDHQVEDLAGRVEGALDPSLTLLSLDVGSHDATRRGAAILEQGFEALRDAQDRLSDALMALLDLRAVEPDEDSGRVLKVLTDDLDQAQRLTLRSIQLLDEKLRQKGLVYMIAVTDKRQVGNARRTLLLFAIFDFWSSLGRKVSFTTAVNKTDPLASDRSGPLIDLCTAVIRLASKDGRAVSADTIVDTLRSWRGRT